MNAVAATHIVSSMVALAAGALVFLLPKGTGSHRIVGRVYVVAMLVFARAKRALAPFRAILANPSLQRTPPTGDFPRP